ncbi:ferric enterobactin transport protein FepE [Salmonella enterica subsp. arizonae]|uniref:Ferric enterobactin transport protein FepE n=1 Tax=Salmonella enterica subsp. arizonae TaxID=59203 RepID=A0A379SFN5_SALER|nr:ferric enterobactin transport protein FepE [Salmonella enterica subsp. arizonae]
MSSLNINQEKNQQFAGYSLPPANSHEIDLFSLMEVLWQAKRHILATIFAFACMGLLLSFLLPQKWTSQAIVTPAESVQWQGLERTLTALRVLDMDVSVDRVSVFNLFIKKFSSLLLLEEYLRSSPYVMDQLKGAKIDEAGSSSGNCRAERKNESGGQQCR